MSEFITIKTFNYSFEIVVLKSILINRSIPHLFKNEHLVGINPGGTFGYGGIDLQIHPNDILQVQQILDELDNHLEIV